MVKLVLIMLFRVINPSSSKISGRTWTNDLITLGIFKTSTVDVLKDIWANAATQ